MYTQTYLNAYRLCTNYRFYQIILLVKHFHIHQAQREELTGYFLTHVSLNHNSMLIKIQPDATVCGYLFTAKSLYMFRASQHPSSGVLKTVTAASGTGHNTGTATSLQRGLIWSRWREVAVPVL